MILVKAQQMKENLCRGRKNVQGNAMNTHIRHLFSRSNISAQYISSAALTGLLTLSVCLRQCTCGDYKTVNSSTDSTV